MKNISLNSELEPYMKPWFGQWWETRIVLCMASIQWQKGRWYSLNEVSAHHWEGSGLIALTGLVCYEAMASLEVKPFACHTQVHGLFTTRVQSVKGICVSCQDIAGFTLNAEIHSHSRTIMLSWHEQLLAAQVKTFIDRLCLTCCH